MVTLLTSCFPATNGATMPVIEPTGYDAQTCSESPRLTPAMICTLIELCFRPMRSLVLQISALVASVLFVGFAGGDTLEPLILQEGALLTSFTTARRAPSRLPL